MPGTSEKNGQPLSSFDALIAATAAVLSLVLATRTIRDFQGCSIDVVDPWSIS
ncbi:MAG: type II toxin-antitoxin system VapC family toxin [Chlorobium sp.]|nr:MAG: type II toxin-antitoxin system VapC family toxin [Chlorobium sp.]